MNKPLITVRPPLLLTVFYIILASSILAVTLLFAAGWDLNILYLAILAALGIVLLSRRHVTMKIYHHYLVVGTPLSKQTFSLYQINTVVLSTNSILIETSFKKHRYKSITLTNTREAGNILAELTPGVTVVAPAPKAPLPKKPADDPQAEETEPVPGQTTDPRRRMLVTGIIVITSMLVSIITQHFGPLLNDKAEDQYDWSMAPTSHQGTYVDILTDGSLSEARYFAAVLDGLVLHINSDYLPLPLNQRPRALIFVNEDNYLLFSEGEQGMYGYYDHQIEAVVVNSNLGIGTAGHVLMHHYYPHIFTKDPGPWFGRGLATHFEKFTGYIDGNQAELTTGYFHPRRIRAAKTQIIEADLAKLVRSRHEHDDLANSFMLFLHHRGLLADYIKANETGRDDLTVLPEIYGAPLDRIEQDWKNWVNSIPMDNYLDLLSASIVFTSKAEFDHWVEDNQLVFRDGRYQPR